MTRGELTCSQLLVKSLLQDYQTYLVLTLARDSSDDPFGVEPRSRKSSSTPNRLAAALQSRRPSKLFEFNAVIVTEDKKHCACLQKSTVFLLSLVFLQSG
jgi:hypothetical protein